MKKKISVNMVSETPFTVQGHGVHTAFLENTNALKKRKDVSVTVNAENPFADVTHVQTVGPYSINKLVRAKGARVISAHVTPDSFVGSLVGARIWYGLAVRYLRWFYNMGDVVLAVSDEVRAELKKMGIEKKITVVPNTIDTANISRHLTGAKKWRKRFKIKRDTFVVIGVGQIQPRKRIDTFVNTAKRFPQAVFIWVGGIPFKRLADKYEEMRVIQENKPKNVIFAGILPLTKVYELYGESDAFFLPSDQETFGIVIVEAAAAGLPIVLRDIAQYRKTFGDTYLKGQDRDFVRIFKRLSVDKTYYNSWRVKAREIAKRYDSRRGGEVLLNAYKDAMKIRAAKS